MAYGQTLVSTLLCPCRAGKLRSLRKRKSHEWLSLIHIFEMAKKYNVDLEVVSSFTRNPGTKVKEGSNMEKLNVSGVARDNNCARRCV